MKRKKRILIGLTIVLLFYINFEAIAIYQYAKIDETRKADAAIILGASVQGQSPSPVFKERINHGIWLYNNGYVKVLIFTGGYSEGNNYSDASVARDYAIEHGIPEEAVLLEEKSTITQENLAYSKQLLLENNLNGALIVSDPLHMKRAMLMAEDTKINAYSSPTTTSRYTSLKSQTGFLAREVFFYIGYKFYRILPHL